MVRILLVDDHPVVRHGIRTILVERLKGAVVGEAGDAQSALIQVRDNPWDVVVADISLPGASGLDLIKELRRSHPSLPTLVVSMHPATQFARRAVETWIDGLRKQLRGEVPRSTLRRIWGRTIAAWFLVLTLLFVWQPMLIPTTALWVRGQGNALWSTVSGWLWVPSVVPAKPAKKAGR